MTLSWFIVPIVVCHFPLPKGLYPIIGHDNVYESRPCIPYLFSRKKKVIVHRQEKLEGSTIELVPNWFAFKICRAKDLSSQS